MKNLFLLFTFLTISTLAGAQTIYWTGGDGDWHDKNNWSSGTVPTIFDDIVITAGEVTIQAGKSAEGKYLTLYPDVTLDVKGSLLLETAVTKPALTVHGASIYISGSILIMDTEYYRAMELFNQAYVRVKSSGHLTFNTIEHSALWIYGNSSLRVHGELIFSYVGKDAITSVGSIHFLPGSETYFYHVLREGILVSSQASGSHFNKGEMIFSDIGSTAMAISSDFTNYGSINMNNVQNNGIFCYYGKFINKGQLDIVGAGEGIKLSHSTSSEFENMEEGYVQISDADRGIFMIHGASLINHGYIELHESIQYDALGSINSELINAPCGVMQVERTIANYPNSDILNLGTFYYHEVAPSYMAGDFENEGLIEDTYSGITGAVNNQAIISNALNGPVQVGVPVNDALNVASFNGYTVVGWYTNSSLTTSAGEYDPGDNTWTPNNAAQWKTFLYVQFKDPTSNCKPVLVIKVNGGVQPYTSPTPSAVSPGGQVPESYTLFPNPSTNGQFTVRVPEKRNVQYTLRVINSQGQQILQKELAADASRIEVQPAQPLPAGIYFVQLFEDGKQSWQQRLAIID